MNKKIRSYLFFAITLLVLLVSSAPHKPPRVEGDGLEYLLITEAFLDRAEVNVKKSDVENLRNRNGNQSIENIKQLTATDVFSQKNPSFYKAYHTGDIYSYHFWLFSVIFSPFVALVRYFERADTTGYLLGNIFFISLAVWYFFRSKIYNYTTTCAGAILLLSVGGIYYLRWPHPEVFSASMLFMGCNFLRERKWKLAALFFAIPGQQNPPILLALPFIFLLDVRHILHEKCSIFSTVRHFYPWLPIGLLAALHLIFFKTYYDVFNLIAAYGGAKIHLISLDRLISLYFDPNLGIFWVIPFACIFSIFLLFMKNQQKIQWKWVGMFFSMSVIFAIPSLSTTNWNHGMNAISRYGVWCAVPIIFGLMEIYKPFDNFRGKCIIVLICICQILLIYFHGGALTKRNHLEFSPIAKLIIKKIPHWYSPLASIFIERGAQNLEMSWHGAYYWTESGNVKKIMRYKKSKDYIHLACDNGYPAWNFISSIDEVESDWVYWNLKDGCSSNFDNGLHFFGDPFPIQFSRRLLPSSQIFKENPGWSNSEESHIWSLGNLSILRFTSAYKLNEITIYGFSSGEQRATILVNNAPYFSGKLPADGALRLILPETMQDGNGNYTIQFHWPDANQASEKDKRIIAFAIRKIDFR